MANKLRLPAVLVFLTMATVAAFWHLKGNEFIQIDDSLYVVENPQVRSGLSGAGVLWALTTTHASNWHPLTWLAHMLDVQLFGLRPGAHHLSNLFLHVANTLLLFLLLRGMTGALWRSALVAALFAVHPLHVESVAWIAERKDVLSTFFWMLTSIAYLRYLRNRRGATYAAVLVLFSLGLMAKPMLVTLPLVFLLLDFWPFGRLLPADVPPGGVDNHQSGRFAVWAGILREKGPPLVLAAASSVATMVAQTAGEMVRPLSFYPMSVRIKNALVSYLSYLGKTLWPLDLAFPYRHPGNSLSFGDAAGAALVLSALTAIVLRQRQRMPYLPAGWFWFLGTLVPVIGLVQLRDQGMADRYTYLPLIGLFLCLAWGLADVTARLPRIRAGVGTAAVLTLAALIVLTQRQVDVWHDDRTLFAHTARVTGASNLARVAMADLKQYMPNAGTTMAMMEITMGDEFMGKRNYAAAIERYRKSLAYYPQQDTAHRRMGAAFLHNGRFGEAARHYAEVVRLKPGDATAHANLGIALKLQGKFAEARQAFQEALRLDPADNKALANLRELQGH